MVAIFSVMDAQRGAVFYDYELSNGRVNAPTATICNPVDETIG